MSAPTIDAATFCALKETAGAEFALELIDTFLQEAPVMLADLRRAMAEGDAEKFRRAAHSLKSNGNTFGAPSFAAMARELEVGGVAAQAASGARSVFALSLESSRISAALTPLRHA